MAFVLSSLRYLKHAYRGAPLGIMIVGHSMGGVVARAAVTRGALDPDLGEGPSWGGQGLHRAGSRSGSAGQGRGDSVRKNVEPLAG